MAEHVPWPVPPREVGPWAGGPPVGPPKGSVPSRASTTAARAPAVIAPAGPAVGATSSPPGVSWNDFADPMAPPPASRVVPAALPSSGLAYASAGRADRAPAAIVALSALVVAALVAGSAYLVIGGKDKYPKSWDSRAAPIAAWVAKARDLDFKHPVEIDFLSAAEYTAVSQDKPAPTAESEREMQDTVGQMRALGFVQGEVDLAAATDTLADSGTLAYYDPSTKRVSVRGTKLTPMLRVTLAHELVHVLQDQHFDLGRLKSLPSSQTAGLRALAEGDAGRIESAYADAVLTPAELASYKMESAASGEVAQSQVDDAVPEALTVLFAAPYAFGPSLVAFLERNGGNDAIDAAFKDPPTDEVLFNPQVWGTPSAELRAVTVDAPGGAEALDSGQFGSAAWYLLLGARLPPAVALNATDGLGGDAYVVYRQQSKVCVRAAAVGDNAEETTELFDALSVWVSQSPGDTASVSQDDGEIRFQSCDPGSEADVPGKVTVSLLVLPVTRTQVFLGIAEAGSPDKVASCVAQQVITKFSVEQLTDDVYLATDPAQALIEQAKDECA